MLHLLFYCPKPDENTRRLWQACREVSPHSLWDNPTSLSELQELLHTPILGWDLGVFHLPQSRDLTMLQTLAGLLIPLRKILVLPSLDKGMLTEALELRPSFFTHSRSEFGEVRSVMEKILRYHLKTRDLTASPSGMEPGPGLLNLA